MIMVLSLLMMTDPFTVKAQDRPPIADSWGLINDWCGFSRKAEFFASMTAFGFAFIPGMQPVAIAYTAVAIAAKGFIIARCE